MKTQIQIIMDIISGAYLVTPEAIKSQSTSESILEARHLAHWISSQLVATSLTAIAWQLNRKNNSSITYGLKKINDKRAVSKAFRAKSDGLLNACRSTPGFNDAPPTDGRKGQNRSVSKPMSDNPTITKPRKCLMCQTNFNSSHIGERVCPSCKETTVWRSGGIAA